MRLEITPCVLGSHVKTLTVGGRVYDVTSSPSAEVSAEPNGAEV